MLLCEELTLAVQINIENPEFRKCFTTREKTYFDQKKHITNQSIIVILTC